MSETRVERTLRYFVRSYVTKPTTINAMTDIPAKIPRPIGSTEIFFPGIWNAAALADGEVEALSAAVTAPLAVEEVGVAFADGVGDGEVGGGGGGFEVTELVGADEEEEEEGIGVMGTDEKTFYKCHHSKNSNLHRVLTMAEDTEDDAEVVVEVLWAEGNELVVDVAGLEIVDAGCEVVVVDVDDAVDKALVDWEATPGTTLHCRTTCTKGSPLAPVTGVNVMTHVWVAGPALLQRERLVQNARRRRTTMRTSRSSAPSA
jgi:hypothetical protein